MKAHQFSSFGIAAALEEINRRNYIAAEDRLAAKMKPARLHRVLPSVLPEDDGRLVWPEDPGHPSNQ